MLVSEIKSRFLTLVDEFQAIYWSNTRLNNLFWNAQTVVYEDLMDEYQRTNSITEDLLPIVQNEVITPASNNINVDTELAQPYERLIIIKPTFTVSGTTYSYYAEPLLAEEKNSVYAQGTVRYPRYEQLTNSSSEKIIRLMPLTPTAASVDITYFKQPVTIDFASPATDIPYTDKVIEEIITKALQIGASLTREQGFFQTESVLLNQSKGNNQ